MKKPRILIVDDNKPILRLLEIILRKDYNLSLFLNVYEAIEWLRHDEPPDLILSDIDMPYINGVEFISHISNNIYYQNIPILVLSGYEKGEVLEKVPGLKVSGYVTKPFDPEVLKRKIEKSLIESCFEINS